MKKNVILASIVLAIFSLLRGIQITVNNEVASKIPDGFTMKLFIMLIGTNVAYMIIDTVQRICGKAVRIGMSNDRRLTLIKRVLNSSISDINNTTVGQINSIVDKVSDLKAEIFVSTTVAFATSIPFCAAIVKLADHPIAIILLFVCSIVAGLMFYYSEKWFKFSEKETKAASKFTSVVIDGLNNIKTLKYISKGDYLIKRAEEAQKDAYTYSVNIPKRIWEGVASGVLTIPTILSCWVFRDTPTMMVYMIVNEWTIYNTIGNVVNIVDMCVKLSASEKLISKLDGSDIKDKMDMPSAFRVHGQFAYGEDSPTFIVDTTIHRCERYLITGESGQGKSTYGNLLAGSFKDDRLDCPDIDVYYIYQETELLNDSLRENVRFYDTTVSDEEIIKLFKELHMTDWYMGLENGLNTVVGEKGAKLSSGLKQRVNIIRTVLEMRRRPNKLFVLDEITSNLDSETRDLAIDLIDRECHSTLIIISHNEGFDKICGHHIHVADHKIILNED